MFGLRRYRSFPSARKSFRRLTTRVLIGGIAAYAGIESVQGAAWIGGGTDGSWNDSANWDAAGIPGSTSTFTSTDQALFNSNTAAQLSVIVDPNRNIKSILFDTGAATYTIGSTTGNALHLSSAGFIQMATNVPTPQIVNAPLVLEPASATTAGTASLISNSTSQAITLTVNGSIKGGTTTSTVALTLTSGGVVNIAGDISNGGAAGGLSVIRSGGGGLVRLTGTNSYTGSTSVTAGTLIAGSAGAINGTSGVTVSGSAALAIENSLTVGAGKTFTLGGNSTTTGGLQVYSGNATWAGNITINGAATTALGAVRVGSASIAEASASLTISGVIANGSSANFNGLSVRTNLDTQTVRYSGANTYTGLTGIVVGQLAVETINSVVGGTSSSNLGAPTTATDGTIMIGSTGNVARLIYIGRGETTDRILSLTSGTTGTSNSLEQAGSGLLKFTSNTSSLGTGSAAKTFTLRGSTDGYGEFAGVISDNGGTATGTVLTMNLVKNGLGSWVLSNNNTYSGSTTVTAGNLILDFANVATPSNIIASGGILTLGGGTLTVLGKSTGAVASSQTLGAVTLVADTAAKFVVSNSGNGAGATLTLGAIGTKATGGTINFDVSGGGAINPASVTTSTNGILGYGTVTDATTTGFAALSGGSIIRYIGATQLAASGNSTTGNFSLGSSTTTIAATSTINSLSIDTSTANGGARTLTLGGASAATLTLSSLGLLMTGANKATISAGNAGSRLGAAGELIIHQYGTGLLEIGTMFSATASITKAGPGTVLVNPSTANTYVSNTRIQGGVLEFGSAGALSATTQIIIEGGVMGLGFEDLTRAVTTLNGQTPTVRFLGSGGFAAYGANRSVNLGGAGASVTWDVGGFVPAERALILGAKDSTNTLTFQNPIALAGAVRTIQVDRGVGSATLPDAVISGSLKGGFLSGILKTGTGKLEINSGDNTFTGSTTIGTFAGGNASAGQVTSKTANGGTLVVSVNGSLSATSSVTVHNGSTLLLGSVTANVGTTDVVNNVAPIYLGTTGAVSNSVGGTLLSGGGSEGAGAVVTNNSAAVGSNDVGLGVLALLSNSTLDFAADGNASTYYFTGLNDNGFTLSIVNWGNSRFDSLAVTSGDATTDRLLFGGLANDAAATALLDNIVFTGGPTTYVNLGNGVYEFGAVPEPSTVAMLLLAAGLAGAWNLRRRRARALQPMV